MTSTHDKNAKIDTRYSAVEYKPTDWPFATDAIPKAIKREFPP